MSPEEVLAQTLRRPNDHATLELVRMAATPLGRSRHTRQETYGVELAGVVVLQQRGTEAACGVVGVKCELAIETRQREYGIETSAVRRSSKTLRAAASNDRHSRDDGESTRVRS